MTSENNSFQVNMLKISVFDGEIPPEELGKINWTPLEGALLASGILVQGNTLGQSVESLAFLLSDVSSWRIRRFQHMYKQWCQDHDPSSPIQPRQFLEWLSKNPPPSLDSNGVPIEVRVVTAKDSDELYSRPPKVSDVRAIKRRQTEQKELLEKAIREAGSDTPSDVFRTMKEWALSEKLPFRMVDGKPVFFSATGKMTPVRPDVISRALKRRRMALLEMER